MKLILENWKKYLKEYEYEDEEYEDDEDGEKGLAFGKLGKHVFPTDMIDPDPEKSKEVDTKLEKMLQGAIKDHFNDKEMWSDPINAMKDLIDRNLYPKIFKKYTKGNVYRGIYVSRDWMRETFGDTAEILHKESDPETVEVDYYSVAPLLKGRLVSSWTTQLDSAKTFAKAPLASRSSRGYGKNISLVLVAAADNPLNYFIDMDPFYDYKFGKDFILEAEVLGVGAIETEKLMWTDTAAFTQRMKYLKQGFYKK